MKIDIRHYLNRGWINDKNLILNERLPSHVQGPVQINFAFCLETREDYYFLKLKEEGSLLLICQRCGEPWSYGYQQQHEFAVCGSDDIAEKYQSIYEPIMAEEGRLDFFDILTDNMYLFLPLYHEDLGDCNQEHVK